MGGQINYVTTARHNTNVHREADALRQYDIISELKIVDFSFALTSFYEASDALLKSLVKAMLEIGTMESLFHQVTYRKK